MNPDIPIRLCDSNSIDQVNAINITNHINTIDSTNHINSLLPGTSTIRADPSQLIVTMEPCDALTSGSSNESSLCPGSCDQDTLSADTVYVNRLACRTRSSDLPLSETNKDNFNINGASKGKDLNLKEMTKDIQLTLCAVKKDNNLTLRKINKDSEWTTTETSQENQLTISKTSKDINMNTNESSNNEISKDIHLNVCEIKKDNN